LGWFVEPGLTWPVQVKFVFLRLKPTPTPPPSSHPLLLLSNVSAPPPGLFLFFPLIYGPLFLDIFAPLLLSFPLALSLFPPLLALSKMGTQFFPSELLRFPGGRQNVDCTPRFLFEGGYFFFFPCVLPPFTPSATVALQLRRWPQFRCTFCWPPPLSPWPLPPELGLSTISSLFSPLLPCFCRLPRLLGFFSFFPHCRDCLFAFPLLPPGYLVSPVLWLQLSWLWLRSIFAPACTPPASCSCPISIPPWFLQARIVHPCNCSLTQFLAIDVGRTSFVLFLPMFSRSRSPRARTFWRPFSRITFTTLTTVAPPSISPGPDLATRFFISWFFFHLNGHHGPSFYHVLPGLVLTLATQLFQPPPHSSLQLLGFFWLPVPICVPPP